MIRVALGIEYDGSRFLGWQTQPAGGTVQVFGWTGDKPVNTGLGTLVFPDIVIIGGSTTIADRTPDVAAGVVTLSGSYPLVVNAATLPVVNTFNLVSGGLLSTAHSFTGTATNLVSQNTAGIGATATGLVVSYRIPSEPRLATNRLALSSSPSRSLRCWPCSASSHAVRRNRS